MPSGRRSHEGFTPLRDLVLVMSVGFIIDIGVDVSIGHLKLPPVAANQAIALRLQSGRLVGAVIEIRSLATSHAHEYLPKLQSTCESASVVSSVGTLPLRPVRPAF